MTSDGRQWVTFALFPSVCPDKFIMKEYEGTSSCTLSKFKAKLLGAFLF